MNGRWDRHLTNVHINYLEMVAVFLTLKHFLPFLKGHHVLVRTDNTTVVAYINRQGGLRSLPLHMLARKLILWSNANLLSLRATHVQGVMNQGADLLSRGNPLYGEWKLNREVVEQIWSIYGRATVDLFASHDNARCPLFFSLKDQSAPLGIDALAHEWPHTLLYAFPPIALISPTIYRVREEGLKLILIAPRWPGKYWLAEDHTYAVRRPVVSPVAQISFVTGKGGDFSSSSRMPGTMGLACEWFNLNTTGLSDSVIRTIQNARASSTRSLYECKWGVFERWFTTKHEIPFQCSVAVVLSFLQDLIDQGKAFSTIKVFLAAISACHIGFDNKTVGQHPLVCRFKKGAHRVLPVSKPLFPKWDLGLVLDALSMSPFEPLDKVDFKILSFKTALLLALALAKRVSEIHALSVHSACLQFMSGDAGVVLTPNPAFMPKIVKAIIPLELRAFYPPRFASSEQQKLNALCPVRALRIYTERTRGFRESDQLFVSWMKPRTGMPITKQRLLHWIVEAISLAYSSKGLVSPPGLRAHSTRGMSTSWGLIYKACVRSDLILECAYA